ncbi:MAG: DUF1236 domain-containing protein [Pseudolabrys sp.]
MKKYLRRSALVGAAIIAFGLTWGPLSAAPSRLSLSSAQQQTLVQAIERKDTTVGAGQTKKAHLKDFQPAVGKNIPSHLGLNPIPHDTVVKIPAVRGFEYVQLKSQVLIVDPMTRKIVAVYPR